MSAGPSTAPWSSPVAARTPTGPTRSASASPWPAAGGCGRAGRCGSGRPPPSRFVSLLAGEEVVPAGPALALRVAAVQRLPEDVAHRHPGRRGLHLPDAGLLPDLPGQGRQPGARGARPPRGWAGRRGRLRRRDPAAGRRQRRGLRQPPGRPHPARGGGDPGPGGRPGAVRRPGRGGRAGGGGPEPGQGAVAGRDRPGDGQGARGVARPAAGGRDAADRPGRLPPARWPGPGSRCWRRRSCPWGWPCGPSPTPGSRSTWPASRSARWRRWCWSPVGWPSPPGGWPGSVRTGRTHRPRRRARPWPTGPPGPACRPARSPGSAWPWSRGEASGRCRCAPRWSGSPPGSSPSPPRSPSGPASTGCSAPHACTAGTSTPPPGTGSWTTRPPTGRPGWRPTRTSAPTRPCGSPTSGSTAPWSARPASTPAGAGCSRPWSKVGSRAARTRLSSGRPPCAGSAFASGRPSGSRPADRPPCGSSAGRPWSPPTARPPGREPSSPSRACGASSRTEDPGTAVPCPLRARRRPRGGAAEPAAAAVVGRSRWSSFPGRRPRSRTWGGSAACPTCSPGCSPCWPPPPSPTCW